MKAHNGHLAHRSLSADKNNEERSGRLNINK